VKKKIAPPVNKKIASPAKKGKVNKQQPVASNASDEDIIEEDIILIENGPNKSTASAKKTLHRTVRLIEGVLAANASMTSVESEKRNKEPVQLGMQVLALKDRETHKWKLARITLIVNSASTQSEESESYESFVISSQYRVVFEKDDESENEDNPDNKLAPVPIPSINLKTSKFLFFYNLLSRN
jgi:hypothetical protein